MSRSRESKDLARTRAVMKSSREPKFAAEVSAASARWRAVIGLLSGTHWLDIDHMSG
jgi:hypothetical protein